MRTGVANLPLHPGKCPAWLFSLMKELGAAIIQVIAEEYGSERIKGKGSRGRYSCVKYQSNTRQEDGVVDINKCGRRKNEK